jgi:NAD-dependent dihydropyrimidine dehydrogenase PreA subunit
MIQSIDQQKCTGCTICMAICPVDVFRMDPDAGKAIINYPEDCLTCYLCEIQCPASAVSVDPFKDVMPPVLAYIKGKDHEE